MNLITVSGPPSSGKTSVILETIDSMKTRGLKVGVVKFDCLSTDDDILYEKAGIPVIHVERGGDITFHGPGQIVMYPIVDLRAARLGVIDYVGLLEEVMIRTASDWGIEAGRNPLNRSKLKTPARVWPKTRAHRGRKS